MKDFYAVLATNVNCDQAEIQAAYEKLLQDFPLTNSKNRKYRQQLNQINRAYDVLGNANRRYKYDLQFRKFHQPKHFYSKAIDITFSIILVFFTIIFADYVITSINHHRVIIGHQLAVKPIAFALKTNHKKHHHQIKTAVYHPHINRQIVKPDVVVPTLPAAEVTVPQAVVDPPAPPQIVVVKTVPKPDVAPSLPDFLYTSRLRANETGIVNMRQFAAYNSSIIKAIPSGAQVLVLERGDPYYKVKFDDFVGFVAKWTLETK